MRISSDERISHHTVVHSTQSDVRHASHCYKPIESAYEFLTSWKLLPFHFNDFSAFRFRRNKILKISSAISGQTMSMVNWCTVNRGVANKTSKYIENVVVKQDPVHFIWCIEKFEYLLKAQN